MVSRSESATQATMQALMEQLAAYPAIATTLVIGALILFLLFGRKAPQEDAQPKPEKPKIVPRNFTLGQLREFDGTNDKPTYIAVMGEVFDVSEANNFYGVGGPYHLFAGRDASRSLAKSSFEEEHLDGSIDDLSPHEKSALYDWYEKYKHFKSYPVVGRLVVPPAPRVFTAAELADYKGTQETPEGLAQPPLYVGVKGKVFDMSYGGFAMYGPGSSYHMFAGRDASRALAKMSFDPQDLENQSIDDLTDAQLKVLDDWVRKFETVRKYPVVGTFA